MNQIPNIEETNTREELRKQIIDEMNARRIDYKTYIDSEWLLSEYDNTFHHQLQKAREEEGERIRQNFKALCTVNNDGDCKYFKDELHNDLRDGAKFIAQHILDEILAPTVDHSELEQDNKGRVYHI